MTWQQFQTLTIGSEIIYSNLIPYTIQGIKIRTTELILDGQNDNTFATPILALFSLVEESGQNDTILEETFTLSPDNDYLIFACNSHLLDAPKIGFKILNEYLSHNPQWTIEIELFEFGNLSSINDILIFINSNTNLKISGTNNNINSAKDEILQAIANIEVGTGGGTPPVPDPLKYYLKGDALNDDSSFNRQLINNGVIIDNNVKKYGTGSFYFNGNSWLDIPTEDILLNNEYCLEFWEKGDALTNYVNMLTLGNAMTGITTYGGSIYFSDGYYFPANYNNSDWHHIACTKNSSGQTIMYFDGIKIFEIDDDISFYSKTHRLGNDKIWLEGFSGWIDSLRLEVGTPKYTANFNPETDTGLIY